MEQKIELVNGKFVVKTKPKEEVKKEEPKIILKEYSEEVIKLRDRVINGNQKLFSAWMKIKEMVHNTEEWSKQMDMWHAASEKLQLLCSELKTRGYTDCLYLDETGKRTKKCLGEPNGFFCLVCTSARRYWEEEFQSL